MAIVATGIGRGRETDKDLARQSDSRRLDGASGWRESLACYRALRLPSLRLSLLNDRRPVRCHGDHHAGKKPKDVELAEPDPAAADDDADDVNVPGGCTHRLDFTEVGEAGMIGSVVSDLHDALHAFEDKDYQTVCIKVLKAAATLAGHDQASDFLNVLDGGSELRQLFEGEHYLELMAKLVKLIPPTGEPEIDIPLGVLKTLEVVHVQHAWEAFNKGEYRQAISEMGDAIMPQSMEQAVKNTRPSTVAPVLAGVVAGYYGYKGRFGYGMRSNFLLTSFLCTTGISLAKRYSRNVAKLGSTALFIGVDEHLVFT